MSASPALGNEFRTYLHGSRGGTGQVHRPRRGCRSRITLLLHLTRGVKIVPGTRVLRKVPSEPEQLLLVASEVEGPEEL